MSGEFVEEYLQATLEPVIRNVAFDEHNEFKLFTPDYMYQGVIGALTAGIIELGPTVAKNISSEQAGHGVIQSGNYNELLDRALELDPDTEAYKMAEGIKDGTTHGNNYNVGELLKAYKTEGGSLFSDYFDAIGADEMPPLSEFTKMYREGGNAWKELSLKKGWKEALRDGEVGPFTRFDEYKAMAGVDEKGGSGYNETVDIDKFDFGKYLRSKIGNPPNDMVDPHAHHILFKKGLGPAQQALVQEGQAILRRVGIDPIFGLENLVWAPYRITGQHDIKALRNVVDKLKLVEDFGGGYKDMVETLEELGEKAAKRRK